MNAVSGFREIIRPVAAGLSREEADLRTRAARSRRAFYRALAGGAEGSRVADVAPGVQATVVPVRPWFSVFNAVIYDERPALQTALPRLRALYREAGVGGWSVWVPPGDDATGALLAQEGHQAEGTPLVMGARIDRLDLAQRLPLDIEAAPTWSDIARCNDRAHAVLPELSMAAVVERMVDRRARLYAARAGGEVACGLVARWEAGDCYFWFVATVPEAQRRGIGAELMRQALRDALAAGCITATLESTRAGERLYEQLGFAGLGRAARWARYDGADPAAAR